MDKVKGFNIDYEGNHEKLTRDHHCNLTSGHLTALIQSASRTGNCGYTSQNY